MLFNFILSYNEVLEKHDEYTISFMEETKQMVKVADLN